MKLPLNQIAYGNSTKPPIHGLIFVYITLFLEIMGATLLLPIVPYIVRQYNTDALTVGLLSAVYATAAFLAAPALGKLSDRWGRRPVLLFSVFGSAIGGFMFGIGGALWVLFISRIIDGLSGGNIAAAMAYIADVAGPKDRAKYFAFGGMAFGLGFIFGPIIAGALSNISLSAPPFAAGGLSLASFLFGLFFLPESLPAEKRSQEEMRIAQINPFSVIAEMIRLPNLGVLLPAIFILNTALNGLYAYITVYTLNRFQATPVNNGTLFMVVGIIQLIGQGGIVYQLTPRFGEKKIAVLGMALQALPYLLFVFVPRFIYLFPLAAVSALGSAFSRPTLDALVANSVGQGEEGRVMGANAALASLTSILGPLAAGLAYDFISAESVFIAGGLMIAVAGLMVARVRAAPAAPQAEDLSVAQ